MPPSSCDLFRLAHETIQELETDQGLLASGKDELYGCLFGRDSLLSALALLKTYAAVKDPYYLSLVIKILRSLSSLQGKETNPESGEEPGKIIHEFRPDNHEHLTKRATRPWFVYSDGSMKNYDSVDSTPLFLIAVFEAYQASADQELLIELLPSVHRALDWMSHFSDLNSDGFLDYRFDPNRTFGGLKTQGWMDSSEALFHDDGTKPEYPIAPVEVQAYAYYALVLWSNHFKTHNKELAETLLVRSQKLKARFNERFVLLTQNGVELASALDGNGKHVTAVRSSIGHCLWASVLDENNSVDCILEKEFIPSIVQRLLSDDLFISTAGIRTLSSLSERFDVHGYHNGTIWPHDTSMIAEGLEIHGYHDEAEAVRSALLNSYAHFNTPLELFAFDQAHIPYLGASGQRACQKQAWSAASLLKEIARQATSPALPKEEPQAA